MVITHDAVRLLHGTFRVGKRGEAFQPIFQVQDVLELDGLVLLVALSDSERFLVAILTQEVVRSAGFHPLRQYDIVELQAWTTTLRAQKEVVYIQAFRRLGSCNGFVGDH